VPIVIRAVFLGIKSNYARRTGIVSVIKEQELHIRGFAGKKAEIYASRADGGAKRRATTAIGNENFSSVGLRGNGGCGARVKACAG
jgi:hypothetical protein